MSWTVVYHQAAAHELANQPSDIRVRLDYIAGLVASFGLERLPGKYAHHLQGPILGIPASRQGWHCSCSLRGQTRTTHPHRARLHKEDPEGPAQGNRV